jgi:gas vesicle protein
MNRDDMNYVESSSRNTVMGGFVLGALLGAGIALIMAPCSGEETRRRITNTARRLRQDAGDKLGQAKTTLGEIREDAVSAIGAGREAFTKSREQRGQSTDSQPYPTTSGSMRTP